MDPVAIVRTAARLPPVLGVAALAAQRVLTRSSRPQASTNAAGAALAAAGLTVNILGQREMKRADTSMNPIDPTKARTLVSGGVYQVTRNPMYVGIVLVLVGHALRRRDPKALLPILPLLAVLDGVQIPLEEEALRATFGGEYGDYSAGVRRWL
ncbi:methyltransferase family protein [Janibacter sp. G56]|uniref:methyltransferase family protein n=1 Tax=Janibacter sp. G56 TaxID=3418717 RepID=UPI003D05DC9B